MTIPAPDGFERVGAWLNLQQTVRVVQARLEAALTSAAGLSWPEYQLLFRLRFAAERRLQMAELAEQLLTSPSGTTRIADRLVDKRLIERDVPDDNRRVVRVSLTEAGHSVLASADRAFHGSLDEAFSSALSDDDVAALRAILRGVLEHNGAWDSARCDPCVADPTQTVSHTARLEPAKKQ